MGDYEDSENFPDYAHRLEFFRLEFFEIYLFNMGRLFEEDHTKVTQTHEDILAAKEEALLRLEEAGEDGYDFSYSEIQMHHEIPELTMNSISIELFYPSFFISLYADFEKSLLKLCDELPRAIERLSVQDIAGNGIERSKTYLVKVLNIDKNFFGNTQEWSKILNYRKLRNHLVHDDRKIPYIENRVIKFIHEDDPNLLSLHKKGGINWVSVNKEYCSDAINVIGTFWVSLFSELSKNFEI